VAPVLPYPEAVAFDIEPEFAGEWYGEVGGSPGSFLLGELNVGQLYGTFISDDGQQEYVLLLEQAMVELESGGRAPGNRMDFTWQDGRGSRGLGWLMINSEDTALTGEFGYGQQIAGVGSWSFIRVDEG
jgi:hypothetical protein